MKIMEALVASRFAEALGWTILHSLWEGAIVACALAIVLFFVASARARYAAASLAMVVILTAFAFTFAHVFPQRGAQTIAQVRLNVSAEDGGAGSSTMLPWWAQLQSVPPRMAPFWMAGVLFFYVRQWMNWRAARRLQFLGVCAPPTFWVDRVSALARSLRISRPVTLLESSLAEIPCVAGHFAPVILMPAGLLLGMPTAQLEAILLHELAHVRRCDYLSNMLQQAIEGLLFYHPSIWWISHVVRAEREHCCDDLVVEMRGETREYAEALLALEGIRSAPEGALAVTGGSLMKRIRRLLPGAQRPTPTPMPVFGAIGLIVLTSVALFAWQPPAPQSQQQSREVSPYTRWLDEEAVYIITDEERTAFQKLTTDEERSHFIEQFWLRRDPTPGTPRNEMQEEHYRRIAYANGRFTGAALPGWKTDRGRIYISFGPPDEVDAHPAQSVQRPPEQGGGSTNVFPFERWTYRHIDGIGNDVSMEFIDREGNGSFRMTTDPNQPQRAVVRLDRLKGPVTPK